MTDYLAGIYVSTWGPIGRRRLRRRIAEGYEHIGTLRTGLLRKDHLLSFPGGPKLINTDDLSDDEGDQE